MVQKVGLRRIQELARLCPILKKFPIHEMNLRYDAEADVLYVRFAETKSIHHSRLTKDDILVEYDRNSNVVGVTILDASNR